MTYYNAAPVKKRRGRTVGKFVLGVGMGVFIFAVGVATGSATATPGNTSSPGFVVGQSAAAAVESVKPATASAAPKAKATSVKPAAPTIPGDGIFHVGDDVPVGTYRTADDVRGADCYWSKTVDAEGSDIIANGLPSGGHPQVTLKKGQWFTSERCGTWVKK